MPIEPRIRGLRRILRLPDPLIERDVDDEIAFHIESRVRALLAEGHSEDDARPTAEREFGDLSASRHELAAVDRRRQRRQRVRFAIETLGQDVRHAVRSLGRSPAFTITAALMLVIGIGAAVAIFAVVNGVLLEPLPFHEPDRLGGAWHDFPLLGMTHGQQAPITYFTYQRHAHTIEGIGVYGESESNVVARRSAAVTPERVTTALFSASLFTVLGVPPLRGRIFAEAEDRPGAPPVMLVSEDMWRAQFGADPKILGRLIEVDGVSREVIGVMPRRFRFPSAATEIWLPLALDPANPPPTAFSYNSVIRLKPGVTLADVQRDFTAVLPRVVESFPSFVPGITTRQMLEQVQPRPVITSLHDDVTGAIAGTLWMVAAAAGLLLLVACANVANLTAVRFDARQRELAVRQALGAGRGRVVRYYFAESAVLAGAAGICGLGITWLVVRLLVTNGPSGIPRLRELNIDGRVLAVAVAITAFATIVANAIPALRIGMGGLALPDSSRGGTSSRAQHRVRSVLVAAQLALALVVLVASGLLVRSFETLRSVRPGFDADHVVTLWTSLTRIRYPSDSAVIRFYSTLIDRIAVLPGVTGVGVTSRLPLVGRGIDPNPLYPENAPVYATTLPPLEIFSSIGGDYLRTLQIPLLAGRTFGGPNVQRDGDAIVSSKTSEYFWHDSTGMAALGKRFRALPGGRWYTVVGVAGNTRDTSLAAPTPPTVYFPEIVRPDSIGRRKVRTMAIAIRTSVEPTVVVPAVQRVVHEMDPTLPIFDVEPMRRILAASTARIAFTMLILAGAAAVTVALGAVGLYGVMAYVVALRRRELGIRIALGASPRTVAAATTRHGLTLAGAGLAIGLAIFLGAARFMRSFVFGVAPWDPLTIVGATLVMLAMAALASWIPARRAAHVDPAEALRAD